MKKKIACLGVLVLSDILVVLICFYLAYEIRSEILPILYTKFKTIPLLPFSEFLNRFYLVVIWVFIFAYKKLYTKRFPFWREVNALLKSTTLTFFIVMILIFVTRAQILFSRTIVILAWLLSLILFPVSRYLMKLVLVKTKLWKKKLIILGVQQTSLLIINNIRKNITMGYEILGFLDDDPIKLGKKFQGIKVLGSTAELESIAKQFKSKDVIVAIPHLPRDRLKVLLAKCEDVCDSMWLIPRSGDFIIEGVEIEVLGEILTLYRKKNLTKPWNIFIKSLFERFVTIIMMIVLLPLFFIISMAIKLESKGPVFFVQKRLGKNKKMFNLYKFRSMYVDGNEKLSDFLKKNPQAKAEWDRYRKIKNYDPRVSRVGKIIRRFSLDELPQLFNILLGNMSLVGPRPYLLHELVGKDSFVSLISKVKPGLTGLWQISGRSELPFKKRLERDEYYIRNWSLWFDFVILIKSIKVLFSSKGAY